MDRDTAEPRVSTIPGERAARWVEHHHAVASTTTYVYPFVLDATADAIGPFCTDIDGNVLMDFTCHVASAPLGYNNPRILDRLAEVGLVDPLKIAGQDFYVSGGWPPEDPAAPGPTQLMHRLADLGSAYGLDRVFLSNSGAEAVENAIKLAYASGGHRAITFEGAFHGRTLGALSLNRSKRVHRRGYPELSGVISVPYCGCEGTCRCGWRTDGPGGNALADRLHPYGGSIDPTEVGFLILEPLQGEGGYRIPNEGFLADIQELVEAYDITLISDEIQAGLGRTGRFWGIDHTPLEPDLICSAKGLRVGATIGREGLFPTEQGRISSTWGAGNLVASMRGVATVDAIVEDGLMDNAIDRGRQFRETMSEATTPGVTDVRGRGLMLALDCRSKDRRETIIHEAFDRGLLVLGCGYRTIRVLPPLDVTEREIELGASVLTEAIQAAA
ncbi:MAG: aminotransferase class III-fold pyridoxal phosphate-dependent enzyme [Halobacteriota archaeon]